MREHGILFKAPMVRALLAGQKTQTRRVVTPRTTLFDGGGWRRGLFDELDFGRATLDGGLSPAGNAGPYLHVPRPSTVTSHRIYPRYAAGDRLWVRETWAWSGDDAVPADERVARGEVWYRATHADEFGAGDATLRAIRWRSPLHLPRWACRLVLRITDVRIQRLQAITDYDAVSEGLIRVWSEFGRPMWAAAPGTGFFHHPKMAFWALWDFINGHRPGCAVTDDPWVVALTLQREDT